MREHELPGTRDFTFHASSKLAVDVVGDGNLAHVSINNRSHSHEVMTGVSGQGAAAPVGQLAPQATGTSFFLAWGRNAYSGCYQNRV